MHLHKRDFIGRFSFCLDFVRAETDYLISWSYNTYIYFDILSRLNGNIIIGPLFIYDKFPGFYIDTRLTIDNRITADNNASIFSMPRKFAARVCCIPLDQTSNIITL